MNVLRQGIRSGIVTTSYPDVPEAAPAGYSGQIMLQVDRCVGDGSCARVCPSEAIAVTTTATAPAQWRWELDDARCVFCGLCAEVCPTDAILISNEFELSARRREDLVIRALALTPNPSRPQAPLQWRGESPVEPGEGSVTS